MPPSRAREAAGIGLVAVADEAALGEEVGLLDDQLVDGAEAVRWDEPFGVGEVETGDGVLGEGVWWYCGVFYEGEGVYAA